MPPLTTAAGLRKRQSKYRAEPTVIDGIRFASKKEARRYAALRIAEKSGLIRGLELQPKFPVLINGTKVCTYKADFAYFENGKRVTEDCKGFKTPVYKLKKRMVEAAYPGLEIKET